MTIADDLMARFEARFWSKVDRNGPVQDYRPDLGPCWIWIGGRGGGERHGYGQFHVVPGIHRSAHRVSYELATGDTADGLDIDHLCRVHECVRPDHLEAVTRRENQLRGMNTFTARSVHVVHCPSGHPYDDENTGHHANGARYCRACAREWAAARYVHIRFDKKPGDRTECPQGHPYDEANTGWTRAGHRYCRACARHRQRQRRSGTRLVNHASIA